MLPNSYNSEKKYVGARPKAIILNIKDELICLTQLEIHVYMYSVFKVGADPLLENCGPFAVFRRCFTQPLCFCRRGAGMSRAPDSAE